MNVYVSAEEKQKKKTDITLSTTPQIWINRSVPCECTSVQRKHQVRFEEEEEKGVFT